ncbi:hypothetical protein ZK99_004888 [Salmonella enterica subsp. enterica]|nr:hypothetical protein [Salmonella enterica subsp. enterica]
MKDDKEQSKYAEEQEKLTSEMFPDIPSAGGVGYQFLYKGDTVHIFNGVSCIEEVE